MESLNSALKTIKFNVAEINLCTLAEGPHRRLAIWFQGCDLFCEGCCNSALSALEAKHIVSLSELTSIIADAKERYGIEGVTYLGGEPTLQQHLPKLTEQISAMGLGIIAFTGHGFDEVKDRLRGCDIVIDGAYDKSRPDKSRRIIGSTNQRIICLTERYVPDLGWFTEIPPSQDVNLSSSLIFNGDSII